MLNLIVDCEQVEIMVVLKILEQITATPFGFCVITQASPAFLTITFTSLVGDVSVRFEGVLREGHCNVFKHIKGC